jgi:hypothetical protein
MPMHFDFPGSADACEAKNQYFFGRQMLVSPVTHPVDSRTDSAVQRVWIPDGKWVDFVHGTTHHGPLWIEERFTLKQVPVFVREGAMWVEQAPKTRAGTGSFEQIRIVIASRSDSSCSWNEDDGESTDYQNGRVARVEIEQAVDGLREQIRARLQSPDAFPGFQPRREVSLRLPFRAPPRQILLDEKPISFEKRDEDAPGSANPGWYFNGNRLEIIVTLGAIDLHDGFRVEIETCPQDASVDTVDFVRRMTRLRHAWSIAQTGACTASLTPCQRALPRLAQTGNRISHFPQNFARELAAFSQKWATVTDEHGRFVEELEKFRGSRRKLAIWRNRQAIALLRETP